MSVPRVVVHTDVLLHHLAGEEKPSTFRLALQQYLCYTTVVQAVDLFALCENETEREAVQSALEPLKILGMNARSAPRLGSLLHRAGMAAFRNALVAGLCLESRLPLLTERVEEFGVFPGLVVITPEVVRKAHTTI